MRATARAALLPWLGKFEGIVPWMYLDKSGRVATGIGTDINSPSTALNLAWRHHDGSAASRDDVIQEWARVHTMQSCRGLGGGNRRWRDSAYLVVDQESLATYTDALLATDEDVLRRTIPNWDDRPAVVQLARLRTAYADGAGYPWPHLDAAITRGDWTAAAAESQPRDLATQNPAYRASYRAVKALYGLAVDYPGDELPDPLPDGDAVPDTDRSPATS